MKVIEEEDERLVLEITGETHTICNILRKRLMDYDEVDAAAYDITHPLIGQPEFEVRAENPRESIIKAANEVKDQTAVFKEAIVKEFEE